MVTFTIRDVPEEIDAALKQAAELNRRSKEKQALFLIESGLRRKRTGAEVLAEARRLRAECRGETSMEEILSWTEAAH